MSHQQNDKWLEHAGDNFVQALAEGNYALCKDIIADVQEVNLEAGRSLNDMLRNASISQFAVKSPLQAYDL